MILSWPRLPYIRLLRRNKTIGGGMMINIALLGLGTVGLGIVEMINQNQGGFKSILGKELNIKKILVKDTNKKRDKSIDKDLLTYDFREILNDEGISIVVEVTSALEESYKYAKGALSRGKHVVTSNKALVSKHFEELSALAERNNKAFLYEASVGGGIPILKPLKEETSLNEITRVQGILNGTCNYILTRMFDEGLDYDETLKIAQELGYAEADPTADVKGHDTQRKLRILATIAFRGKITEDDILTSGINGISSFDIEQIKGLGSVVKLMAEAKAVNGEFTAIVQPTIIKMDSYFATVNMAFNSISIVGNNVGELKFYGPGAGKLPTANAVLRDVMDIVEDAYRKRNPLGTRILNNRNIEIKDRYYLRITSKDNSDFSAFNNMVDRALSRDGNFAILTKKVYQQDILDLIKGLNINEKNYFLGRIID